MHERLNELLACPVCGAELASAPGALTCPEGHGPEGRFPVVDGVPRLLATAQPPEAAQRTVRAFARQWQGYGRLRRIFGKDPAAMAGNLHGARLSQRIDPAWYQGKRVLDAGCGHGRYLQAFAAMGAEVVGLDIGPGPAAASPEHLARIQADERLDFVQGSVLEPPFRPASFDLVFSDGVIHHTPDAPEAYARLARLVKPGGALYVWVYPREGRLREAVFGAARAITTRLPGIAVQTLAFALAPLTIAVRSYSGTRFGQATWGECAQVVHDWIAPPLQSHHSVDEVRGWAAQAGLVDVEELPVPTGITAWRSA